MTMEMFGTSPAVLGGTPTTRKHHGRRALTLGIAVSAALALFAAGLGSTASADTSDDTTVANVEIAAAIALTGLTPSFTLVGLPGSTVTGNGEVAFNVEANNAAGYSVTVQPATSNMLPGDIVANPDAIPVGSLTIRQGIPADPPTAGAFTALNSATPVTIHSQAVRSGVGGDDWVNDFQITIPFIASDTYTATLNYIATEL